MWAALACAVGPSANHREEQSYNTQRTEVKQRLLKTVKCPLQALSVLFMLNVIQVCRYLLCSQ